MQDKKHDTKIQQKTYEKLNKDTTIEEDTKSADLRPLNVVQMVRIQPLQRGDVIWKEGKAIQKLTSRSYLIKKKTGTTVRRNRLFITLNSSNSPPYR